jgi:hypothetical protein
MISSRSRYGLLVVFLLLLSAGGCTGSDPLAPQNPEFTVAVEWVSDEGSRFELGSIRISQLVVDPVDPDAQDALASAEFALLRFGEDLELRGDDLTEGLAFPKGVYRLVSIKLGEMAFIDTDPPPDGYTCREWVSWFVSGADPIFLSNFGEDVYFTVQNGAPNRLTISIDTDAFISAFLDAKTCRTASCPGGYPLCDSGAFLTGIFTSQAPQFLSFASE